MEFDSPAEQPLVSRVPNNEDSFEYWRGQLRQMKGAVNEWRRPPEPRLLQPWQDPMPQKFAI